MENRDSKYSSGITAENILSSLEELLIVLDKDGEVTYVNSYFKRTLEYTDEDILGKNLGEFFSPLQDDGLEEEKEAELTIDGIVKNYNVGIITKNGNILPFNISLSIIINESGKNVGMTVVGTSMVKMIELWKKLKIMNDTLEAKVKERTSKLEEANAMLKDTQDKFVLSEKMSAMSLLAGGISHEISNPIMAIIGYSDILIDDAKDEESKEKLLQIKEFGFNCMNIISKFCDFAMSPGSEFDAVNLNKIIEDTLVLAQNKLKYDVEITKELDADLPIIKGEANELRHVIINVVLNAKDAMPKGGKLLIRTGRESKNIFVLIEDTGKGIPGSIIGKIFDTAFTTKKEGGTGLGLSVAFEIIKAHDGNIEIESEEGVGTKVKIILPIPE
ncbi:MAG: PAS domain-containing protein [Candidatus Aureabacteria bacterium]|nr:PAS domain-containing protein [Candidatus Auribacterota bacterium]